MDDRWSSQRSCPQQSGPRAEQLAGEPRWRLPSPSVWPRQRASNGEPLLSHLYCTSRLTWGPSLGPVPGGQCVASMIITSDPPATPGAGRLALEQWKSLAMCLLVPDSSLLPSASCPHPLGRPSSCLRPAALCGGLCERWMSSDCLLSGPSRAARRPFPVWAPSRL